MRQIKVGLFWGAVGFMSTYSGGPVILTLLLTFLGYFVTLDLLRLFTKE